MLWARAESVEALTTSFTEIAHLLKLPEKDAQEQAKTIEAVKRWLKQQREWLLILDNADSPALLPDFLPPTVGGHLLITTRAADLSAQIAGLAHSLVVDTLSDEQGALFLLRRSGLLALDAMLEQAEAHIRNAARSIAHELGGLPLALGQAGAYLKATGSSLVTYQQIYQQRRAQLLKERRGVEHLEPVATTWNISFQRVEETNPAAADLLRLCAFFAPDAIPEEILTEGAEELGPVLAPVAADAYQFNEAIESLRAYSLITRDPQTQTLTVHRLVQEVVGDSLSVEAQQQWKQRTVLSLNAAFPSLEFANWPSCERLLPHVLRCISWIESEQPEMLRGAPVLHRAGLYLYERGRYKEAEPLLKQALTTCEQQFGMDHPITAMVLNSLALLYERQGRYTEAEPLLIRALETYEQYLGAEHPETANNLNNLAGLYQSQGRYTEAEPLYQRTLAIYEQQLGAEHPNTIGSLSNLALLRQNQGRYAEAEPLLTRVLTTQLKRLGVEHPDTATNLNNLGELYREQGKYEKAEPLLKQALALREKQLGAEHPDTAGSLNNLALLYGNQGRYKEAELLYRQAGFLASTK